MALRTLKPRLGKLSPRLSTPRQVRDTQYSPDAKVRGWYKSAQWRDLREQVLIRDAYQCQKTGIILAGGPNTPTSPVVHHKVPHAGDELLFWDINNLIAVSKAWHDSEAQSAERNDPEQGWTFAEAQ